MKKLKVISIFIILLTLFSLCSMTVNAEETPDVNKIVVIVDEDYRYYGLLGMVNVTWTDYLNIYNTANEDSPFAILGDYVIYENSYLTCRGSLVNATATVTNSTGAAYYLGDTVYTVAEDTITFSANIPESMLFIELIEILSKSDSNTLLTMGGFYGELTVYYNSRTLKCNDITILSSHNVGSFLVYELSELCTHYFDSADLILKEANCIEDGLGIFTCRQCKYTEERVIPLDAEYGHSWNETVVTEPTHFVEGVALQECIFCAKTREITIPVTVHEFSQPTCTEPSYCIIEGCGVVHSNSILSQPLGHSFSDATCTEPGVCQRSGCNAQSEVLPHSIISTICEGTYCKACYTYFEEPQGHLINSDGECTRSQCDYVNSKYGWETFGDKWNSFWNGAGNVVSNVGQGISKGWNSFSNGAGNVVSNVGQGISKGWNAFWNGVGNSTNNFLEYIFPGEDGKGLGKNLGFNPDDSFGVDDVWKILLIVLSIIPIIFLVYFILRLVVKFKNAISKDNNNKSKKTKKRKKKNKGKRGK